jgi:hypothetical protein
LSVLLQGHFHVILQQSIPHLNPSPRWDFIEPVACNIICSRWLQPRDNVSIDLELSDRRSMINLETDRVLITGAAGAIGTALRDGLRTSWRRLRLVDIRPVQDVTQNEEAILADVAEAMSGMFAPSCT